MLGIMSETTTSSGSAVGSESQTARAAGDAEKLLHDAEAALADVEKSLRGPSAQRYHLSELVGEGGSPEKVSMELLQDVNLDIKIELGRTRMNLDEILQLRKGSVVTLDKLAGDPVDVYVNGRLVARGEVLVLNDNFCVRVAELIGSDNVPGS
jgi:flagellar motor switch protein FliN